MQDQEKMKSLMAENGINPKHFDYEAANLFIKNLRSTISEVRENEKIDKAIPIFSISQVERKK
jgi:hypothetical protein